MGFNESYIFTILENCSLRELDAKEHLWIQRLKAIKTFGLTHMICLGYLSFTSLVTINLLRLFYRCYNFISFLLFYIILIASTEILMIHLM